MIYHLQHRNKKNSKFYKFQGSRIKEKKKGKSNHNVKMKKERKRKLVKVLGCPRNEKRGSKGDKLKREKKRIKMKDHITDR